MPAINCSMFKNDRKERDNQPDFTGPGQVTKEDLLSMLDQVTKGQFNADQEGRVKVRIAGWKKTAASGKAYISLSVQIDDYGIEAQPVAATSDTAADLF